MKTLNGITDQYSNSGYMVRAWTKAKIARELLIEAMDEMSELPDGGANEIAGKISDIVNAIGDL